MDPPCTAGHAAHHSRGAIANDVHDKNHHRAGTPRPPRHTLSFGAQHRRDDRLQPSHSPEWFAATLGGIGLTGLIATVELQLQSGHGSIPRSCHTLASKKFLTLAHESETDLQHTVSWLDCTSGRHTRGLFFRAKPAVNQAVDHARRADSVPLSHHRSRCSMASRCHRSTPPISPSIGGGTSLAGWQRAGARAPRGRPGYPSQ